MSDLVRPGESPFDRIRRVDERGEHWTGRDMMPLAGYPNWQHFRPVIERAMQAATNTGLNVAEHFTVNREIPSDLGGRPREDFRLTRHAAYLVALNGDPRKKQVAEAQEYFAVKTRQAELQEAAPAPVEQPATNLPDLSTFEGQLAVIDLLRDQVEGRRRAELEAAGLKQENAEMRPKVAAADAMRHWDGTYEIGAVAQMFGLGQNTLFKILYDERILRRDNRRPYQKFLNKGWFRVVSTPRRVLDEAGELVRVVTDYKTTIYPDGALKLYQYLTGRGYKLFRPQLSAERTLFALESPTETPQLPPGGAA